MSKKFTILNCGGGHQYWKISHNILHFYFGSLLFLRALFFSEPSFKTVTDSAFQSRSKRDYETGFALNIKQQPHKNPICSRLCICICIFSVILILPLLVMKKRYVRILYYIIITTLIVTEERTRKSGVFISATIPSLLFYDGVPPPNSR